MRQGHRDALRGREPVFTVENHAVAAIKKYDRGARAVIFALVDHEVGIRHIDGNFCALPTDGIEERFADVEIHGVAKLIGAGDAAGLDPRREVACVVAAETAAAERAEEVLKSFETEEVDGLVGNFE